MDPLRIAVRVVFAYVIVRAFLRVAGRRPIRHGDISSFVVALIIGDMFDDLMWAEVPAAQFVVGIGTLVFVHLLVSHIRFRAGERVWARQSAERAGQA